VLPCTLNEFFDKYVADDALYPYETYMQSSGDTVLEVTPWKKEENGVYARIIEYNHPVNAPLAPPMARARKEQRYRRYGENGLSIETDTYVEDVPMADCFYVTDRVLVEPNADGAVVVLAEFDMRFVKSTMFRALISNTTQSEFLKWFQGLEEYWAEAMAPLEETPEEQVARRQSSIRRSTAFGSVETVRMEETADGGTKTPVVATSAAFTGNLVMIFLLILVLVMQSWLVLEVVGMKKSMSEMESRMTAETCPTLDK